MATAAASLVNWNFLLLSASASTQLTGASFSMAMAMIAGVTLLYRVGRSAIPLALALSWALFSIGANLGASAAGTPGAFRAKCVQELGLEAVNQLGSFSFASAVMLLAVSALTFLADASR